MTSLIAAGNSNYLSGTSMPVVQQPTTNDQATGSATAAAAVASDLSDVQLQELYTQLVAANAGLTVLSDDLGATAIATA